MKNDQLGKDDIVLTKEFISLKAKKIKIKKYKSLILAILFLISAFVLATLLIYAINIIKDGI